MKPNLEKEWNIVRRGWFIGGESFKEFLLDSLEDVLKKGAFEKAAIAWLIRSRTTVGNRWIADRLQMRHPGKIPPLVRKTREASSGILLKYRRNLDNIIIS